MCENSYDLIPGTIDVNGKIVIPSTIVKTLLDSNKKGEVVITNYVITMQEYQHKVRCLRLYTPNEYRKFEQNILTAGDFTDEQMGAIRRQIFSSATRHMVRDNCKIKIHEALRYYANLSSDVWFVRDELGVYLVSSPEP